MLKHKGYKLLFVGIAIVLSLDSRILRLQRQVIHIELEDEYPIFKRPHQLSASERVGIQTCCQELLAASLIELSNGEYACVMFMSSKNDVFGNSTKKWMCGDYYQWTQKHTT